MEKEADHGTNPQTQGNRRGVMKPGRKRRTDVGWGNGDTGIVGGTGPERARRPPVNTNQGTTKTIDELFCASTARKPMKVGLNWSEEVEH